MLIMVTVAPKAFVQVDRRLKVTFSMVNKHVFVKIPYRAYDRLQFSEPVDMFKRFLKRSSLPQ